MSHDEDELYFAYATHLRDEHRQLRTCLEQVERQWQQQRQAPGSRRDILEPLIASLTDLRRELGHHFSEEESGGCLEEAVLHDLRLSRAASELEHEDPRLVAQLDKLIERLRSLQTSIGRVRRDYGRLVRKICEHAAAESRIVQESFGIEVD